MNDTLKRISFSSLMFVMVFAFSFGSFVPSVAGLTTGDLVTGPNSDAVYYINGTSKNVFPDAKTFFTWYTNFDDIQTVTVADLDGFTTGTPVSYRPGTRLVTHPNTARIYAVEPNGNLRWVPDEATAVALYGADWSTWVRDVHELTFGNYTVGSDLTSSMHSEGTILQATGDSTIYYYDGTNIRPFADSAAFDANNLNFDFVVEVPSLSGYSTGSSISSADTFATISGVGVAPSGPAGSLTVALSPNTPPANTLLLGGAARVPITTIRLTTGSTEVVVDSITVERQGVASDAAFTDFDLLQGADELPLNNFSKSLNASHQAVFGDDFTVPANTSWDVTVAANMAASLSLYAGEYPTMGVVSITLKNNSTLSGTLPISGNVFLTNGTITVGASAVTVGANNPTATTKEIGTKDYIVSSIKITNNSSATLQTHTVKSITFTQNGSASFDDVENLRLVNNNTGATVATIASPTGDKVTFIGLSITILKGNSVNLDLRLDIKSGSARTISYDIDKKSDVVVFDELRGYKSTPTYTDGASAAVTSSPFYDPADTSIGNGKLRIESVAIQDSNIGENQDQVLLGKFKFVMEGESGNITALGFKFTTTTAASVGQITNVTLKDPAGATVAGPVDLGFSGINLQGTATSTDTITVPVGENIYNLYADLDSNFAAEDTIQAGIFPEAMTLKGDVSGNTITPTPAGQIQATNLTVKAATMAISVGSAPAAQTVVGGTSDYEFGRIILDASNSGTDIRVTQMGIKIVTASGAAPSDLSDIELFDGATEVPVSSTSQTCAGATCSTINTVATTTLSIDSGNLTVPKGQTKELKVKSDIGTAHTAGTFQLSLQGANVVAIDAEAQSITSTYTVGTGNLMTLSAGGTLNLSLSQDPSAANVVGGTTVTIGQFTAQAKNEGMKINSFAFTVAAPGGGVPGDKDELEQLAVWESGGSSALGTVIVNGAQATVTPSVTETLAINEEKTYIVKATFRDPATPSVAQSGAGVAITMSHVDVDGTSAGSSSVTLSGHNSAFKDFHVYKSVPVVSKSSISADQITGANTVVDLYKFSVTANSAGPIGLSKFTFGVSTSSVSLIMSVTGYYLYESDSSSSQGDLLADTGDMLVLVGSSSDGHVVEARFDENNDRSDAVNNADAGEHLIINAGTTKYFTFRGTPSAISATANDDSVATVLAGDPAYAGTALENVGLIDATDAADDFIWSDLNFDLYSSSTATKTEGWFNGYRVSGLDNTSSTPQTQTD